MSKQSSQEQLLSNSTYSNASAPPGAYIPYGQATYTSEGTYTWVAPEPASWTGVSVVVIGGGSQSGAAGGETGGALSYGNNIPVNNGENITVLVGRQNPLTYFKGPGTLYASKGAIHGGANRNGGGNGGPGGPYSNGWYCDGGGGAGGYSGPGGRGGGGQLINTKRNSW